jgi:hypothetical protein
MATRLPKPRKPPETLRRRNAPEQWTVLPAVGCDLDVPPWPFVKPSKAELELWARLWALPVAVYWWDQHIEPTIRGLLRQARHDAPGTCSCLALMKELGLTPAALQRLRLIVEAPEPVEVEGEDPYRHLQVAG